MAKPGSFKVPALVTKGSDKESVLAQMNINQNRERLNSFAEAEALRQLVVDHCMPIGEAGEKSWVRVKPLQRGVNFNIHWEHGDEPDKLYREISKLA